MASGVSHRDLLLCVMAREQKLLADDQLQRVVERWIEAPEQSLGDLLQAEGQLSPDQMTRLRAAADVRAAETCLDPMTSHLRSLPRSVRALLEGGAPSTLPQYDTKPTGHPAAGAPVIAGELAAGDRFSVLQLHAQGGLGVIFQARDEEIDRVVALKQIKPQWADDVESRARFTLEAKITGRLEHPGIVPIYALGADQTGRPYYAMRLIRGESLLQVITRFHRTMAAANVDKAQRHVQLRKLLARFIDVCNALEYAHSHGIIHRDVKPANVMLGKFGETLVVDWGLAKVIGASEEESPTSHMQWTPLSDADSTSTRIGMAVGTPAYMSPEQAAGCLEEIGPASDVYSLGATLYQLLTGATPHGNEKDLGVVLATIGGGDIVPLEERAPWLPRPLAAICRKAMEPHRDKRYLSARALANDVDRWLADEPVRAYNERWRERAFRWVRNHRTLATSLAAAQVVAAAALLAGMLGWNYFQSQRRADQQSIERQQQQRYAEQAAAAAGAEQSAAVEIRADRFESALTFLNAAAEALADHPQLTDDLQRVNAQRERIARFVRYFQRTRQAEEMIAFQNDSAARRLLLTGVQELGVLEHGDWWAYLPVEDLTPQQADWLRFDVYRQLILLTANYAKGAFGNILGPEGAAAARNTLAVAQRVQRFRPTSSTRWHASCARFRLGQGIPLRVSQLAPPANGPDAYMLGALAVIATQNQAVAAFFAVDSDSLLPLARRELLLASSLDPEYYWIHFVLGFTEMIAAGEPAAVPPEVSRPYYQNARRAFSQCIAIEPDYWLAYAERCSSYRQEIEARRAAGIADETLDGETVEHLREMMLRDLQRVRQLNNGHRAADWYVAFALHTAGQTDAAVDVLLTALQRNARFDVDSDVRLLDPEMQRALPEVLQIANSLLKDNPDNANYLLLRAGARLRLEQWDAALQDAQKVLAKDEAPPFALVVRGSVRLKQKDFDGAENDFQRALRIDAEQTIARIGLARTHEATEAFATALTVYDDALEDAETVYQIAAIQLGRCRSLLALGNSEEALLAFAAAREAEPSSEAESIRELAATLDAQEFLKKLAQLVAEPDVAALDAARAPAFATLPILDGQFELGLGRHWNNLESGAMAWHNVDGCQSEARTVIDRDANGRVLHVANLADKPEGFGVTSQTVPADPAAKYRLSFRARGKKLDQRAARIVLNDQRDQPIVELPAGSYDWQRFTGDFDLDGAKLPRQDGLVPVTLRIEIHGRGEFWIDDVRVEVAGESET